MSTYSRFVLFSSRNDRPLFTQAPRNSRPTHAGPPTVIVQSRQSRHSSHDGQAYRHIVDKAFFKPSASGGPFPSNRTHPPSNEGIASAWFGRGGVRRTSGWVCEDASARSGTELPLSYSVSLVSDLALQKTATGRQDRAMAGAAIGHAASRMQRIPEHLYHLPIHVALEGDNVFNNIVRG